MKNWFKKKPEVVEEWQYFIEPFYIDANKQTKFLIKRTKGKDIEYYWSHRFWSVSTGYTLFDSSEDARGFLELWKQTQTPV